jgi:predicted ATPase
MSEQGLDEDDYSPALLAAARERFIVISGCSGGGKSSLVNELARRGFRTVAEAGRQVIREQNSIGGDAVPGRDVLKFLDFTISRGMHQMILFASSRTESGVVFFDRSIIDQANGFNPVPPHLERALQIYRYGRVFIVPPWPEKFRTDAERTHSFEDALAYYGAQLKTYERLGYPLTFIPKVSVSERADFVLNAIGKSK